MGICSVCGDSVEGNYTVFPVLKLDTMVTVVKYNDGTSEVVPNVCAECKDKYKKGIKVHHFRTR